MLFLLAHNIGYNIEGVGGFKSENNFAEKQKKAWEFCKKKINRGLPCYGWELDETEYYVINGYYDEGYCISGVIRGNDDEEYCFSGPSWGVGEGSKRWQELADTDIGQLAVFSIKPRQAAEDTKTIKDSIECVLHHAKNPKEWIFPQYKSGLAGFDNWIKALETGTAIKTGMAYNAACWAECRGFGVQFLKEARERVNGKTDSLFDEAEGHYKIVHENLQKVAELFPFQLNLTTDSVTDSELSQAAIKHLRDARKAEKIGLNLLEEIHDAL